jgi:D-alanyl-D-alanine carboxypeptidase
MKKLICLLMAAVMLFASAVCAFADSAPEQEQAAAEWNRQGYYADEAGNMLSVTWMDDVYEPGWYVGFMNGEDLIEDSYGGTLLQEGNSLYGILTSSGSKPEITVTVSEEDEDCLLFVVQDGETYHFSPFDMGTPVATLWVNTEGYGFFTCDEEGQEPDDNLWTSLQYGLAEPATYVLTAKPGEDWVFVKWTLNGEDYSADERITINVSEDSDVMAVFEYPETETYIDSDADAGYPEASENSADGIDYLALVNKLNPLPEGWEDALETVTVTNSVGDEVEVEAKAYEAYLALKADLEENDNIYLELDSARRSVAAQQDIMDRFIEKYGADYAAKTVAQPGYSEHHTGLALDLYFKTKNEDGSFTDVYYNEDMEKPEYTGIWDAIHGKLADYGFILRYLKGEEHITGYRYEPWHIRYVDSIEIAQEIMSQPGMTMEEYLAGQSAPEVEIDLGNSALYTEDELYDAILAIKCRFASMAGCELHTIRYAGDEANSEENLKWLNSIAEGMEYTQAAEFLTDFHSPVEDSPYTWEPDTEYYDYQWWLARPADGDWEIVSFGY